MLIGVGHHVALDIHGDIINCPILGFLRSDHADEFLFDNLNGFEGFARRFADTHTIDHQFAIGSNTGLNIVEPSLNDLSDFLLNNSPLPFEYGLIRRLLTAESDTAQAACHVLRNRGDTIHQGIATQSHTGKVIDHTLIELDLGVCVNVNQYRGIPSRNRNRGCPGTIRENRLGVQIVGYDVTPGFGQRLSRFATHGSDGRK